MKITHVDIETSPEIVAVWSWWDTNVVWSERPWFIMSMSWKEDGKKTVNVKAINDYTLYKKDKYSDKELMKDLWHVLNDSDVVVAHNGKSFDIKKLYSRFLVHGMNPPSPVKVIDTKLVARKHFGFLSNKLDDLARLLGIGHKTPHTGKDLWRDCLNGDEKAWAMMKKYNKNDVVLLEEVYHKMRPFMDNHPNFNIYGGTTHHCPNCDSSKVQKRGFNHARTSFSQRYQCMDCGAWSSGNKMAK